MDTGIVTKLILILSLAVFAGGVVVLVIFLISFVHGGIPLTPTPATVMKKMVELAELKNGEKVYDLGCGDGRIVIEASKKYGAIATGVEISPLVFYVAKIRAWLARADVTVIRHNLLKYDFSDADVIFCYLCPNHMQKLEKSLGRLKKGARIISHQFEIPGWTPARNVLIKHPRYVATVFKYQV